MDCFGMGIIENLGNLWCFTLQENGLHKYWLLINAVTCECSHFKTSVWHSYATECTFVIAHSFIEWAKLTFRWTVTPLICINQLLVNHGLTKSKIYASPSSFTPDNAKAKNASMYDFTFWGKPDSSQVDLRADNSLWKLLFYEVDPRPLRYTQDFFYVYVL